MKNNKDLELLKNKIEQENIQPPKELDANGVKNIIYPEQPKRIKLKSKRVVKQTAIIAACIIAFVAVGVFAVPKLYDGINVENGSDTVIAEALPNFSSYGEIKKLVKQVSRNEYEKSGGLLKGFGFGDEFADEEITMESNTISDGATQDSASYSETNVQVEGIDEADIIKNDGKYIYYVSAYAVNDIKIYKPEGDNARLVSTISDFAYDEDYGTESICDIFVNSGKLVVNTNSMSDGESYTNSYIYDLADISSPKVLASFSQSGYYLSSRMIGEQLYVVSNKYYGYYFDGLKDEDYAPKCGENGELETMPIESLRYVNGCDSSDSGFLVISSIDIGSCERTTQTQAIFGMSADIYCNENNMYAASLIDYANEVSEIFKISLSREKISFDSYAKVEGSVNNQFSMDEYNGYFRIAVTKYDYSDITGEANHKNLLYIFDEDMNEVGRIDGFAKGESIKSVRFMEDIAYVITYEDIDPLFVIDLSNPSAPEILGEVEITGFSSQLIPVDENTVLGIGYSTVPSGFEDMERTDGIKLVLFDVTDKSNPLVLDSVVFDNASSYAQNTHKAVAIDRKNERYAIDYTVLEDYYNYDEEFDEYTYSPLRHIGAITFEIENGKIIVTNKFEDKSVNSYTFASRCTFLNDYVYLLDDNGDIYSFKY